MASNSGLAGYQAGSWQGILAPTRMPPDIVARLNQDTTRALALAAVKERLLTQDVEPAPIPPEQFTALVLEEQNKRAKVIRAAGTKAPMK